MKSFLGGRGIGAESFIHILISEMRRNLSCFLPLLIVLYTEEKQVI